MKDDLSPLQMADVPDPAANIAALPLPPRPTPLWRRAPTRSQLAAKRVIALVATLAYEVGWIAIMNKRDDLYTMPRGTLALELAIPLVTVILAVDAAASAGDRGLGLPKARLTASTLIAPAVFVLATIAFGPSVVDPDPFWPHSLRCLFWTALYSAGPLALATWAFRRSFLVVPAWRTAALAMGCGASGAVTITVVCSVGSAAHVLVGHGAVMLIAGLAGAAFGRRVGQI
jgi:hypothetical protein